MQMTHYDRTSLGWLVGAELEQSGLGGKAGRGVMSVLSLKADIRQRDLETGGGPRSP
jgi:hypothetical protein